MPRHLQELLRGPGFLRIGSNRMDHCVWQFRFARRGEQLCPRDRLNGRAQIKHCRGQMFRRMNFAADAENFLRRGNAQIVDTCSAKVGKARAHPRRRSGRQQHASRPAVQVNAKVRPPSDYSLHGRRQNRLYVGIPFEYRGEPVLHHHRHLQIGPALFQDRQCRCGEYAVAQGTQSDDGDPRSGSEPLKRIFHAPAFQLLFDLRFVDQHHWDVVPDWVNSLALGAFQPALVRPQVERSLAERAHQYFQKIFAERHN